MSHPALPCDLPWLIVGFGRVGQTLALLADQLNVPISATWNRRPRNTSVPSPDSRHGSLPQALHDRLQGPALVWLTVVDDAITEVFDALAPALAPGSIVVHTSGSLPSTIMNRPNGVARASLHPLQAIADPQTAVERLHRTFWTVEGDLEAVEYLSKLVLPAGIEPIRIASDKKILYHAAAVTAANLLVSLMDAAIAMAEAAAIEPATGRAMLVELAQSSLENLVHLPPSQALTGPVARGDHGVIDAHQRALEICDDDSLAAIYTALTERAIRRLTDH